MGKLENVLAAEGKPEDEHLKGACGRTAAGAGAHHRGRHTTQRRVESGAKLNINQIIVGDIYCMCIDIYYLKRQMIERVKIDR